MLSPSQICVFEQMTQKVLMCNPIFNVQYFVEANAIALRRVSKDDMRHIAKATGATQVQPMFCNQSTAF